MGKPVVMLPLCLFSDDTSGNRYHLFQHLRIIYNVLLLEQQNRSKKWHKFDLWALLFAGLPRHENSKLENIHLICCSDKVSALEMSQPISDELLQLELEGVEVYDSYLKQNVLVVAPLLLLMADNPRASELINHMGSSANYFCRICQVQDTHFIIFVLLYHGIDAG